MLQTLSADHPDVWIRESVFVVSIGTIQAGKVLFNKQHQLSTPDIEAAITPTCSGEWSH
uniref:Uncharacterized protein n=1 Tax=mine drainage metagenome TaxID=410659 RepID=E6PY58_9ZZZZ